MKYLLQVIALCVCLTHQAAWGFDLSVVRVPDNTESPWVGRGIEHNGVTMDIKLLKSSHSSEQLLDFYKHLWESEGGQGEGYTMNEMGDYKIISKIEDNHNIVVQVRNDSKGNAEGYLSAIDLSSLGNATSNDDFPALSNTMLVSKTVSEDAGKSAVTRILINNYSVASNAEFYVSRFESEGWQKSYSKVSDRSYMGLYSRNKKTMELAISRESGKDTVIFANTVDEN